MKQVILLVGLYIFGCRYSKYFVLVFLYFVNYAIAFIGNHGHNRVAEGLSQNIMVQCMKTII